MDFIIGVDGRELEGKPTGVGNYLRNILRRAQLPHGARLQIFFKNAVPDDLPGRNPEPVLIRYAGSNLVWEQCHLSRELRNRRVRLFFSPAASCPWHYSGIQVVTIHDFSYFRYPNWFTARERLSRQVGTAFALRQADRVYVVSDYIGEELRKRFRTPSDRIVVTPNAVDWERAGASCRDVLRKSYDISNNTALILYAGSIFNRRHLPVLIESMAFLNREAVLFIIGENRTHPRQDLQAIARQKGVDHKVRLLEYVPDKVLHDYYQMADVFVYLSTYEGFGVPPLEAISYGVPVVLSYTPAMNTIFRDAALFVESFAPAAIANTIERCLCDESERSRLIAAGHSLSGRYNWEETARIVSGDWERLLAARS